jgi:hypothetical protein
MSTTLEITPTTYELVVTDNNNIELHLTSDVTLVEAQLAVADSATIGPQGPTGESPVIHIGENPPSSPTDGMLWWHKAEATLKVWYEDVDSGQWVDANSGAQGLGGGGDAIITVSDTPPSTPDEGHLWWSELEGVLKVYYTDTDSSQWVDASSGAQGDQGVQGPAGVAGGSMAWQGTWASTTTYAVDDAVEYNG